MMGEKQPTPSTDDRPQQTRDPVPQQSSRRIQGKKFMNKQGTRIDAKTFKAHGGVDKFKTALDFKTQAKAQALPITTRGLGFMLQETSRRINIVAPNIDIPVAPLYRSALAQVHGKMVIANEHQHHLSTPTVYAREYGEYSFLETLKSQPRHLNVIANYINSIGNFKCGEIEYYVRYYTDPNLCPRIDKLYENLNGLVEVNAANLAARTTASQLNSIPTACFVLNPVAEGQQPNIETVHLQSIERIIPQAYTVAQLRTDLEEVSGFLERLGRKHENYIGSVNLNETGSCAQLVTTEVPAARRMRINNQVLNNVMRFREVTNDSHDWYTTRIIPTNDFHTGIMLLCGEAPAPNDELLIHEDLSLRTRTTAIQVATQSWRDTFAACLN